jgi:hypothetical protein
MSRLSFFDNTRKDLISTHITIRDRCFAMSQLLVLVGRNDHKIRAVFDIKNKDAAKRYPKLEECDLFIGHLNTAGFTKFPMSALHQF